MAGWKPFLTLWSVAPPMLGNARVIDAKAENGLFRTEFGTDADRNVRLNVFCTAGWKIFAPEDEAVPEGNGPWTATVRQVAAFRFLHHPALWPGDAEKPVLEGLTVPQRASRVIPAMPHGPYLPDGAWIADRGKLGVIAAYPRLCQTLDRQDAFVRAELDERPGAKGPWWLQFRFPFQVPLLGDACGLGELGEAGRLDPDLVLRAATDPLGTIPDSAPFQRRSTNAPHQREAGGRRLPFIAGGLRKSGTNMLESFAANAAAISALHGHVGHTSSTLEIDLVPQKWWPKAKARLPKMVALTDGFWWAKHWISGEDDSVHDVNLTLEQALAALAKSAKTDGGPVGHPILAAQLATSPARTSNADLPDVAPRIALLEFLGLPVAAAKAAISDDALNPSAAAPPYHYLHTRHIAGSTALEWRRWVPLAAPGAIVPVLLRVRQPKTIEDCAARGFAAYAVTVEGLDDCHVLDLWTRLVGDRLREAAETRFGRDTICLLPRLEGAPPDDAARREGGRWIAQLDIEVPLARAVELMGSQMQPAVDPSSVRAMKLYREAQPVPGSPGPAADWFNSPLKAEASGPVALAAATAMFPTLRDHRGSPLTLTLDSVTLDRASLAFRHGADGWSLETAQHRLTLEHKGAAQDQRLAIGGLDVSAIASEAPSPFRIEVSSNADPLAYDAGVADPLRIPLARVDVGGSDDREPVTSQPLVWSNAPIIERGELVLTDRPAGATRSSSLSLHVDGSAPARTSSVSIIDPAPMSVATVKAPQLTGASATRSVVATWQTAESYWRVARDESQPAAAEIVLPPQGLAEAWERSGGTLANHLPPDQIGDDARVPARLPPTSQITVETEERLRNPAAPWNLRRLLGDIDVDLPGGRLLGIGRLEALYGLEARSSSLAGLRVAEASAWRGTLRRAPDDDSAPGDRMTRWRAAERVFDRRLALLDVRAEAAPLAKPVIAGVSYRLRPDGRYVDPVKPRPDGSGGVAIPPRSGFKWTPSAEGGILGGALAGFEYPGVIEDLLEDAPNGRGRIDGLVLSALGAWTGHRADFNGGLSLIAADLHMGRVDEARFERKGRIGATHHLAKHVIVYRRSVLPSRQLYREQNHHLGRPIVRKAEEYIEIMQPTRHYPDRAGAPAKRSGPLVAGRFRTTRIPVNGSWARDLPDPRVAGYYIPLWTPDEDAAVYPRPVVEMLLAGDPARTAAEPVARRVENPEQLRFYTLTGKDVSPEVESWPNVYGLDLEDRPLDHPLDGTLTTGDFQAPGDPGRPLPPAVAVPAGLERFTLGLEQGPGVNLGHGRFAKPLYTDLRNLTLMRGMRVAKPAPAPASSALRQVQQARSLLGALADMAQQADEDVAKACAQAKQHLEAIAAQLPSSAELADLFKNRPELTRLCDWVQDGLHRIDRQVEHLAAFAARLPTPEQWEVGRQALLAEIARVEAQALELGDIDRLVSGIVQGPLDDAAAWQERLVAQAASGIATARAELKRIVEAIEDVAGWLPAPLADPAKRVEDIRRFSDGADRLEQTGRALAGPIAQAGARLQKIAPKEAAPLLQLAEAIGQRTAAFSRDLKDLQRNATETLGKAQLDAAAWQRETTGAWIASLERSRAELEATLDRALGQLKAGSAAALAEAKGYAGHLGGLVSAPFKSALETLQAPLGAVADAVAHQPYPENEIRAVRTAIAGAVAEWQALEPKVAEKVGKVCDHMNAASAELNGLVAGGGDTLRALIGELDTLPDRAAVLERVAELAATLDHAMSRLGQGLGGLLDGAALDNAAPANLAEDAALNLLRAAGAPPVVEQLAFNRDQLAYYFEAEFDRIVTTPVTALLDQGEAALRGMGVALPTLGLADTLLAPMHDAFSDAQDAVKDIELKARDVLKDFAGLKDMLPKLEFDSEFARAIAVTHDYDAARRMAWLQADVTYGPKTAELFSYDAFAVMAQAMSLHALSRYERALSGEERRRVTARLTADWVLQLGGTPLVRIRDAIADYDDRKGLSFDIKPENIAFTGAIQLLTKALEKFNKADSPLTIELIEDDGRPIGLKSRYDMPPTTFTFGAVTILNASLGVHLDLAQRAEFEIRVFAYFGRQAQPFSLVVGWLGGGGYLEAEAIHRPRSQSTEIAVALSIGACAGVGFAFGPLAGYVQVYLGLRATYRSGSGGARLNIAAVIVVSGSVTAWGFVTVSLGMHLAITYQGDAIVGRGQVQVSVRISRFYTKRFSRPINYQLGA